MESIRRDIIVAELARLALLIRRSRANGIGDTELVDSLLERIDWDIDGYEQDIGYRRAPVVDLEEIARGREDLNRAMEEHTAALNAVTDELKRQTALAGQEE